MLKQHMVNGEFRAVHRIDAHGVHRDALESQFRQSLRGLDRRHRERAKIVRRAPQGVPAGVEEEKIDRSQLWHSAEHLRRHPSARAERRAVEHIALAAKLRRVQLVQIRRVRQHMRRGVHVRAGVGIQAQPRLAEAVALQRIGRGQLCRLCAGIDHRAAGDRVGQIKDFHGRSAHR